MIILKFIFVTAIGIICFYEGYEMGYRCGDRKPREIKYDYNYCVVK
jgi:hypothetical protein